MRTLLKSAAGMSLLFLCLCLLATVSSTVAQSSDCDTAPLLAGPSGQVSYVGSVGSRTLTRCSGGSFDLNFILQWKFIAPSAGQLVVSTMDLTSADTILQIGTSCSNSTHLPGNCLAYSDDYSGSRQSQITLSVNEGVVYYISLGAYSSTVALGTSSMSVTFTCPADTTRATLLFESACVSCAAGTYVPSSNAVGTCEERRCLPGTTDHDSIPATACVACGAGTDTSSFGLAGPCSQYAVPAGKMYDHDSNSSTAAIPCSVCTPGSFNTTGCSSTANTVCPACTPVVNCTSGLTCTAADNSRCGVCMATTYANHTYTTADRCLPCRPVAGCAYSDVACTSGASSTCSTQSSGGSGSTTAIVAAVVAVAGVGLAVLVGVMLWRRRRQRHLLQKPPPYTPSADMGEASEMAMLGNPLALATTEASPASYDTKPPIYAQRATRIPANLPSITKPASLPATPPTGHRELQDPDDLYSDLVLPNPAREGHTEYADMRRIDPSAAQEPIYSDPTPKGKASSNPPEPVYSRPGEQAYDYGTSPPTAGVYYTNVEFDGAPQ
ncbi:hypothetical protein, variant [Capsaspora owczarzaki ATCC 30864]|uniref:TNFR-Cys domain-containing protein n=1 Tax=Capsaspora owczarzaki (strain ATCC 30864) TaxID=595528 RepID=E9CF86_CAPO3|nr:hypothetical protein CAOG_06726 [Capsaspora owczarzaki ATCC 30864]XP_011270676.1 hypothetical protein, variant [Capsaspora owczarzaki ATCC 30864]KJE96393.1 hypothetical protein CAOG_006726 [Capsaspora owczarzaki ATCC 30864]|eukprot:XP_004344347.1 hypothetical protein CAOG_06726 [Capsaspora owczarzaki ATCC 30864]